MLKRSRIHLITTDKALAAELSMALVQMGYAISGIDESVSRMDINAAPKMLIVDGRNEHSLKEIKLPVLYLSENDEMPPGFKSNGNPIQQLLPPFNKQRLKQQLDQLIPSDSSPEVAKLAIADAPLKLEDRIFVRHKEKMVKLEIENILYVEADRNYSRIFSKEKEYMVAITLKTMEAKLPDSTFYRIHRSYIVNLRQIDEVAETHLVISRKALPISKSLRAGLMKRLQTI